MIFPIQLLGWALLLILGWAVALGRPIGVLMLISELAPLLARSSPVEELQTWDPLRGVRERMPLLGVLLITTQLLPFAAAGAMLAFSGSG